MRPKSARARSQRSAQSARISKRKRGVGPWPEENSTGLRKALPAALLDCRKARRDKSATMATPDSHATHAASAHSAAEAEPQTPMWLPAVGVFLFLVGGVYAVTTRTPDASETEATAAAATQSAAPAKPAATPAPRPAGRPPTVPPSLATLRMPNGQAAPTAPVIPRRGH